jgi:hypothetical protein
VDRGLRVRAGAARTIKESKKTPLRSPPRPTTVGYADAREPHGREALHAMSVSPHLLLGRRAAESPKIASGKYLTDGHRLPRIVSRLDPRTEHRFAVLEDCITLELDAYAPDELATIGLRAVPRHGARFAELTTTVPADRRPRCLDSPAV